MTQGRPRRAIRGARTKSTRQGRRIAIKPWWRQWWLALIVLLAVAGGTLWTVTGGEHSAAPDAASQARPLTEDEADRLAVTRFRNYQVTGVSFSTIVPSANGPLPLTGFVDFRRHLGYAVTKFTSSGTISTGVIQWNLSTALSWSAVGTGTSLPAIVPAGTGDPHAITAADSSLDTVLLLLLNLGSDRPDNSQLLRQSDARWLNSTTLRGTPVDVFQGPSSSSAPAGTTAAASADNRGIEYAVDSNGKMFRFAARLASGLVTVDLAATPFVAFPQAAGLT